MCSVSVVNDYWRQNTNVNDWTRKDLNDHKKVLEILERLDEKFNQKDCEDPAKLAWMSEVEDRLEKLEK